MKNKIWSGLKDKTGKRFIYLGNKVEADTEYMGEYITIKGIVDSEDNNWFVRTNDGNFSFHRLFNFKILKQ